MLSIFLVPWGRQYQRQGRVSELGMTSDGALVAWVSGTRLYATEVAGNEEGLSAAPRSW